MRKEIDFLNNADLSRFTTLKTGGCAEKLFVPRSVEEFSLVLKQTPVNMPITLLGLGSNALIPDDGIKGLVIVLQGGGLNQLEQLPCSTHYGNTIKAEAGVACGTFARFAARLGFSGMEFMAGIPGTIGGALAMNAGCYNGETWDLVSSVMVMNRQGEVIQREKAEFDIAYRSARLLNSESTPQPESQEYFISANFDLTIGNKQTALSEIKKLLAQRNQSQPTNYPNCGSVFRNPKNNYAARLIEACGLKGVRSGNAQISEKHANFIVNLGGAKTKNIIELMNLMQSEVKKQFDISLEREVRYLGNENGE